MALRIVPPSEPIAVKQIVTAIYGAPGLRKSSMAFTADAPLLLDFDHGVHRAFNRGPSVPVSSWADVAGITAEDMKPYRTLVLDTAGRALDALSVDITTKNPKHGYGGALSLQGYGELKTRFSAYLNLVRSFGLDVVLLVHMDEQRRGDDLIERLDMQGSSKNEVYKSSDLMGRISVRNKQYYLNFSPTETAFGKNPAQFDELVIPDFANEPRFLADVITKTKEHLNRQTAQQAKAAGDLAEWEAKFANATNADELNVFIPLLTDANAKRLLLKVGGDKGLVWNRTTKAFDDPAPATREAKQEALV